MDNAKSDVLHGSLALMVLRTLDTLGPQHGWEIARRSLQIGGDALLAAEAQNWERISDILARCLRPSRESL